MDTAAAEQIARLLAQVEPLSRDNERLAADNASLARAAAEAGRAHQGLVRDAVADRLRAQRQVRQRAAPVPDGIRIQVPGRADIAPEHGQLGDEGLGAVAVQAAGEDEGAAAGRRHSPRRRDRGAGAQGARARGQAQVAHVAVRGARVREADIHLRIQPGRARQIRPTPQGGGLAPELRRGQPLQFNPPSPRVPMGDVHVQVRLEGLEVGPSPSLEELVLHVSPAPWAV